MPARADAHLHLFEQGYVADRLTSEFDVYRSLRSQYGVGNALVVGYEGQPRFAGNNAYLEGLAAEHRWIRPLAHLPQERPPAPGLLRGLLERGFVGWSCYLPDTGPTLTDWADDAIVELATTPGILSLNAGPVALSRVERVLDRLVDHPVMLSHLGLPATAGTGLAAATAPVVALARRPNVRVKLSGLYAIDSTFPHRGAEPVVETILQAYGAERVLWGSDFSPALGVVTQPQMMTLPPWLADRLTDHEIRGVLGANLDRILGSSDPPSSPKARDHTLQPSTHSVLTKGRP